MLGDWNGNEDVGPPTQWRTMIVLLPVSRYRVRYQVASGRPFSFFERFILEGVRDGHSSIEALERMFRVHRRVLIEGLVTLVQAGWVAIDRTTHELLPTKAGLKAIGRPDALPRNIVVLDQVDHLIGERVQGQVAKGTEVTFSPRSELRPHMQQVAVMPPRDLPHPLDAGILVPLLRTDECEWIHSCGPIDIVRDGADYAVVDVDTSSEIITGIPGKWIPLLRDELLDRARSKERHLVESGTFYSTDPALTQLVRRELATVDSADVGDPDEWVLDPALDRVIVGPEHHTLVENWLETARSYICIVSGTLNHSTVARLDGHLRDAVRRGVVVDVMWGDRGESQEEDSHKRAFEILKKIEWDSHHSAGRGRLTVGRQPIDSNARILFGDVGETFEAAVGSFDWLSSDSAHDASVLFREPNPVARIARLVGDFAAADERLSTGVGLTCLRHAVEGMDRQAAESAERRAAEREKGLPADRSVDVPLPQEHTRGKVRVRIVVGRQNHAILPILAGEARRCLIVLGHRWGGSAAGVFKALNGALERGCRRVELRYGEDIDPGKDHDDLAGGFEKLGGVIRQNPSFHARLVVVDDDTAAVTSFDWLCPGIGRRLSAASDIGFVLYGEGVGRAVLDRLGIPRGEAPAPLDAEYVTGFRIERLRSVNRVEWQLGTRAAPGWHVLVGDNGSGKTSILRAVALALIGSDNAQKLRQDWSTWLRGSEATAEAEVFLQHIPGIAVPGSQPSTRSVALRWERTSDGAVLRATPAGQNSVLSAGFGPFRRFSGGDPEYERQLAVVPGLARHISLFDERVALTESLAWLRDLRFKSLENDPESTLLLDRITKLINESGLLPCGVRLAQITSDTVFFRDAHDYEYGIEELSDGYRSVLSLAFDIVRHLAIGYGAARVFDPENHRVVSAPAVVLIDEVDAHLHPSWQRTVGQWFRLHFPRIQFIVTTHSPLICQAAQDGSVYRLPDPTDETDVGAMLDGPALARLVYGNVLEAYASGAFGEGITRSDTSQAYLHRLAEINRKEITSGLSRDEQAEQEKLRATLPLTAHTVKGED